MSELQFQDLLFRWHEATHGHGREADLAAFVAAAELYELLTAREDK